MRNIFLAVALLPIIASSASASIFLSGGPINPPDGTGLPGASDTIVVGASETITGVEITLHGFTHTWIGDLIITLTGPGGSMDIMFRTGSQTGLTSGDGSNVNGSYTFADGGADWWLAASLASGSQNIPTGTYEATTVGPYPGNTVSFVTTFAGSNTAGNWTLTMSDHVGGDVGGITSWDLDITSFSGPVIPEPTSALIFAGLMGMALVARRKLNV